VQSYFGFSTMPFGRALAPGMLFASAEHTQAAARISYGIATRGITVITGEVGVGKTVAARPAIDRAEPAPHHLIYIPNPPQPPRRRPRHLPPHRRRARRTPQLPQRRTGPSSPRRTGRRTH